MNPPGTGDRTARGGDAINSPGLLAVYKRECLWPILDCIAVCTEYQLPALSECSSSALTKIGPAQLTFSAEPPSSIDPQVRAIERLEAATREAKGWAAWLYTYRGLSKAFAPSAVRHAFGVWRFRGLKVEGVGV